MTTFVELTKRVQSIIEHILSGVVSDKNEYAEKLQEFHAHLLITKNWFSRISWTNKKRFLNALLQDITSLWTISLVLKSIWDCRPKDAVLSVSQAQIWSSYDQVPMDHNRTALLSSTLKEVMMKDRQWFLSLDPELQAKLICELLMISGGPIMWDVLQCAQAVYNTSVECQLNNILECNVVNEPAVEKVKIAPDQTKKDLNVSRKGLTANSAIDPDKPQPGQAQKELEASLAAWHASIKALRDRTKLEEMEMIFKDGTKKTVWKVNRPKPEATETVDIVQLLPSEIGKRILMNIPIAQLPDCARVNKYWSYLVDELRSELTARQKINIEFEKLKENMIRHDVGLDLLAQTEFQIPAVISSVSTTESAEKTKAISNRRLSASAKSRGLPTKYETQKKKSSRLTQKPIRNLNDLSERLERRGAADENLWKWCKNVLDDVKQTYGEENIKITDDGLLSFNSELFPCPLINESVLVPLKLPLINDPRESVVAKKNTEVKPSFRL